jgi:micrococcal nuclease
MSPLPVAFSWRGRCVNVVDGDTIDVELDTGFHNVLTQRVRLYGVNTPELHTGTDREAGQAAKLFTAATIDVWQPEGVRWPLWLRTYKTDSFGRYLADVYQNEQGAMSLSAHLIAAGHGVPFFP